MTNPPCDVITGPTIVQKDITSTSNDIVSYGHEPHVSILVNHEGHMPTLIICTRFVLIFALALCFTQKFSTWHPKLQIFKDSLGYQCTISRDVATQYSIRMILDMVTIEKL